MRKLDSEKKCVFPNSVQPINKLVQLLQASTQRKKCESFLRSVKYFGKALNKFCSIVLDSIRDPGHFTILPKDILPVEYFLFKIIVHFLQFWLGAFIKSYSESKQNLTKNQLNIDQSSVLKVLMFNGKMSYSLDKVPICVLLFNFGLARQSKVTPNQSRKVK